METSQPITASQGQKAHETRVVKAYLTAIEPGRGTRRPSRETLEKRLARVIDKIAEADDPVTKIDLIQTKLDIEKDLASTGDTASFEELESAFIEVGASYAERKGISYTAWREFGVSAKTLRAAGIPETRRR